MKLRQLEYAVAVAEERHFGRAAERCHVTQPTLSQGLSSLESDLGAKLFERGRNGVVATRAGEDVVERARRILAEVQGLRRSVRAGQDGLTGILRLGVIPTIGPYLMPRMIGRLRKEYPDLRLELRENRTARVLERLRSGVVDAAVVSDGAEGADLVVERIYREPFVLAVPPEHPLARLPRRLLLSDLERVEVLLLEEGHCLRDQVEEICRKVGARRESYGEAGLETLRNMVAAGVGCTLLPALAMRSGRGVRLRRFADPQPARDVNLVYRAGSPDRDSMLKLLAAGRKSLPRSFLS